MEGLGLHFVSGLHRLAFSVNTCKSLCYCLLETNGALSALSDIVLDTPFDAPSINILFVMLVVRVPCTVNDPKSRDLIDY